MSLSKKNYCQITSQHVDGILSHTGLHTCIYVACLLTALICGSVYTFLMASEI